MNMQDEDFKWFKENHANLFKDYPNKFVVIKNKEVLYAEKSFSDAITAALNGGLELETFIIQECTETAEGYIQEFHSRAVFL